MGSFLRWAGRLRRRHLMTKRLDTLTDYYRMDVVRCLNRDLVVMLNTMDFAPER